MGMKCCGGSASAFNGARAHSTGVTVVPGISKILGFNTVDYDTDAFFSLGSDSTAITIPADGKYLFGARLDSAADTTAGFVADVAAEILVNGGGSDFTTQLPMSDLGVRNFQNYTVAYEDELQAGDVLKLRVTMIGTTGGNESIGAEFWIEARGV